MDRDLIAAVRALANSYRTLVNSSLVYEEATTNVSHQAIRREVEAMIGEFRATELQHAGQTVIPLIKRPRAVLLIMALADEKVAERNAQECDERRVTCLGAPLVIDPKTAASVALVDVIVFVAFDASVDFPDFGPIGWQTSLELYLDEVAVGDRSGFDQFIGPASHQIAF